jgi:hypothetical protein
LRILELLHGFSRAISTDGTLVNLTAANSASGRGLLAFRLKGTLQGKPNHALARLKSWSVFSTADIQYKVIILPGTAILETPAITWTSVPGYGWCEYIKDFGLVSGWAATNAYSVIVDEFAAGGSGQNSGRNGLSSLDNSTNAIYQNFDSTDSQIMAVIGYRLTTNADTKANLTWVEIK